MNLTTNLSVGSSIPTIRIKEYFIDDKAKELTISLADGTQIDFANSWLHYENEELTGVLNEVGMWHLKVTGYASKCKSNTLFFTITAKSNQPECKDPNYT